MKERMEESGPGGGVLDVVEEMLDLMGIDRGRFEALGEYEKGWVAAYLSLISTMPGMIKGLLRVAGGSGVERAQYISDDYCGKVIMVAQGIVATGSITAGVERAMVASTVGL